MKNLSMNGASYTWIQKNWLGGLRTKLRMNWIAMVGNMERKTKNVVKRLNEQYQNSKYGKLHKKLLENGINADLYVGIGIEMHYPDAHDPSFVIHLFDSQNMAIIDVRGDDEALPKALEIIESLKYRIRRLDKMSKNEIEEYF